MGALAPVSSWVTEDDLLLKNAIEAGASLESLAKGAVRFSRKFTVQELQDRWHSLLYDPVVSKEASSHMIEFEQNGSAFTLKLSRAGSLSGKRKSESVRTSYYALRKRIRNEPLNSLELGFLVAPPGDNNCFGNEDDSGNCLVGEGISNVITDVFNTTMDNQIEEGFSSQAVNIHDNLHHIVGESGHVENLPVDLFEYDGPVMKPTSTFDCVNTYRDIACSEFEENRIFNSPVADFDAPFQNLEFSSPLPDISDMSIWRDEGLSASTLAVDECLRVEDSHVGDRSVLLDVGCAKDDGLGLNVGDVEPDVYSGILCDPLKDQTASAEGYLVELTNTLLSDEPFFLDVDGKDAMEKSYFENFNSLLLSSPNDGIQDCVPEISVPEIRRDNIADTTGACLGVLDNNGGSCISRDVNVSSEVPGMISTSASTSQRPELTNGVIVCTLNTEDPEIPCNDDIIFPSKPPVPSWVASLAAKKSLKGAGNAPSVSVKGISGCQKAGEKGSVPMQRDQIGSRQLPGDSQVKGSMMKLEKGQRSVGGCKAKPEDPALVACTTASFACGDSTIIDSRESNTAAIRPAMLKDNRKEDMPNNHLNHTLSGPFKEKPAAASDSHDSYPQSNAKCTRQEVEVPAKDQNHQASEVRCIRPPIDSEELSLESDDDVPYSSDIEAMILDMDLDPEDHNLYDREVVKYEHEDTRKAIIRLEQGARSYIRRAIASHRAFAVLYGRNSKYYIKKPEVLLGRATEDIVVDIDLTREGRGNKVSRRQAIINMKKDGSFHLKNVGKRSVSVNSREIAPGRCLGLSSSCLIEIRGIAFIFETNQTCVKQYLDSNVVVLD